MSQQIQLILQKWSFDKYKIKIRNMEESPTPLREASNTQTKNSTSYKIWQTSQIILPEFCDSQHNLLKIFYLHSLESQDILQIPKF